MTLKEKLNGAISDPPDFLDCINPANLEKFDQVRMATDQEILSARREMDAAAKIWAAKPIKERVRILRKLQEVIIDSVDEITAVINKDHGKSRQDAGAEVLMTVDKIHQYLKRAHKWLGKKRVPPGIYFFRRYSYEYIPFGVVGIIGPWNYPFELIVPAAVSALLAGNTVMVKPSEVAASTGALIEELFKRVPELSPFIRFLHGDARVGANMVASKPNLIFLTGSTNTGKIVAKAAAEHMIPFLCELGGKDPMIVLEDADLRAAAKWGVWSSAFFNSGQSCVAVERIYVVEKVYDQFLQMAIEEAQKAKIGYTESKECEYNMGPLTFHRQLDIVEGQLQDALEKGARVAYGGTRKDMFIEPTILVDVDHSMEVMWEETFGPLIPIMKVKDEAHAVQLANHSKFGLSAYIWSGSRKRAQRLAQQMEVGTVNINDVMVNYPVSLLPFGGVKMSGNARTHGKEEVMQYTQIRSYAEGQPPLAFDVSTILRYPNHYRLMMAVIHFFFGVTPRQKAKPLTDLFEDKDLLPKAGKAAAATGVLAALSALVIGLFRARKN